MKKIEMKMLEELVGGDKWDKAAGLACGATVGLMFTPLIFLSPITAFACGALTAHAVTH